MPKVTFLPSEKTVDVEEDQSLLTAALQAGIPIATACGGVASCTECKVQVMEGAEHLSDMEYVEESKLGNVFWITQERLACQTQACGDLTVRVLKEQLTDKRARARIRALKRAKENLARRASKANDELRRRLALLNDDGDGQAEPQQPRGRPPRPGGSPRRAESQGPPRKAAPPKAAPPNAASPNAASPKTDQAEGDRPKRKRRRRRRRRRSGGKAGGGDNPQT